MVIFYRALDSVITLGNKMTTPKDFTALTERLSKYPEELDRFAKLIEATLGEIAEQERLLEAARKAKSGERKDLQEYLNVRRQL